jgi:hypothetical protein
MIHKIELQRHAHLRPDTDFFDEVFLTKIRKHHLPRREISDHHHWNEQEKNPHVNAAKQTPRVRKFVARQKKHYPNQYKRDDTNP